MLKRIFVVMCVMMCAFSVLVYAQNPAQYFQLDPKPYNPNVDVNTDLFLSSWQNSSPRSEHGNLVVRDIFTKHLGNDPLKPTSPGCVLNVLTEYAHATLPVGAMTSPSTLSGEQKIFYILSGEGSVKAGRKSNNIEAYTAVLIPEGLEFTIANTGDTPLTMLSIGEPTYKGFKPLSEMVVKKEKELPIFTTTSHWVNIVKGLFSKEDGAATIIGMSAVWLDPVTIAQPHASNGLGTDVLWYAIEGNIYTLFGKKLYNLKPGMAFKNPSDGKVYHGNINVTDKQIKLLWLRTVTPEEFAKLNN